ncbi:MAG: DUF3800 domain-containing protein [Planctomycetaceae bacterium]|nr:DUF3800 domain-containing protein [Planctomycetaceae bacterium]
MKMNELVIYTDESEKTGRYYSNFYGGLLVRACDIEPIISTLETKKLELNLLKEVKWVKVTENYLEKYMELMDTFFDFVEKDQIKIRIMFTQNRYIPTNLSKDQLQNQYHLLYYQFFKHAFGLPEAAEEIAPPIRIRINIDQMPVTREQTFRFKSYLEGLNFNSQFYRAGIYFPRDQIAEINSKDHVLLQCLDVVLGAMVFRLNDKHLEKPEGSRCRGKKTIAKEKLYKHILKRIQKIYPGFNIGISTGFSAGSYWAAPYRHWLFIPKNHEIDSNFDKHIKKAP